MILQPKSNNIPEKETNAKEAIVSAGFNMIPGSENAAAPLLKKKAKEDAMQATPRQENKTPVKEEKPVLG